MSLVRLLAAGKSVVGMSDDVSPYRLTQQRLLPRFGPPKKDDPGNGQNRAVIARVEVLPSEPKVAAAPQQAPPASAGAPAAAPRVSNVARAGRWLAGRFQRRSRSAPPKPEPQPAKPGVPPPVQGELLLDHVKVVRNDLSDCDFELAQLRPRAATATEVGMGKRAPSRLAGMRGWFGVFGAGRGE